VTGHSALFSRSVTTRHYVNLSQHDRIVPYFYSTGGASTSDNVYRLQYVLVKCASCSKFSQCLNNINVSEYIIYMKYSIFITF